MAHHHPACLVHQPNTTDDQNDDDIKSRFCILDAFCRTASKYAAYLNLIEPWWKVLHSLALKGRRFETWAEIEQAVERATAYWNEHKHPFIWGRRRRHRQSRRPGVAALPAISLI